MDASGDRTMIDQWEFCLAPWPLSIAEYYVRHLLLVLFRVGFWEKKFDLDLCKEISKEPITNLMRNKEYCLDIIQTRFDGFLILLWFGFLTIIVSTFLCTGRCPLFGPCFTFFTRRRRARFGIENEDADEFQRWRRLRRQYLLDDNRSTELPPMHTPPSSRRSNRVMRLKDVKRTHVLTPLSELRHRSRRLRSIVSSNGTASTTGGSVGTTSSFPMHTPMSTPGGDERYVPPHRAAWDPGFTSPVPSFGGDEDRSPVPL